MAVNPTRHGGGGGDGDGSSSVTGDGGVPPVNVIGNGSVNGESGGVQSWSYSHFMYRLRLPFENELSDLMRLKEMDRAATDVLLARIHKHCDELEQEMRTNEIHFRPDKIFVHSTDVDYEYPVKSYSKSKNLIPMMLSLKTLAAPSPGNDDDGDDVTTTTTTSAIGSAVLDLPIAPSTYLPPSACGLEATFPKFKFKFEPQKRIQTTVMATYDFIGACRKYIMSSGIIAFDYLYDYEVINKYLTLYNTSLPTVQHPITGDTVWHLQPFLIDLMSAKIHNLYNFRDESPKQRRRMATQLDFPPPRKFPVDQHNVWTEWSMNFVDRRSDRVREPLALCRYIKKRMPQ